MSASQGRYRRGNSRGRDPCRPVSWRRGRGHARSRSPLFRDGRRLMAEGDVAQACAAFAAELRRRRLVGDAAEPGICRPMRANVGDRPGGVHGDGPSGRDAGAADRVLIAQQKNRGDGAAHRSPDRGGPGGECQSWRRTQGRAIDQEQTEACQPSRAGGRAQITASAPGYRELDDELRGCGTPGAERTIGIPALEPAGWTYGRL